MSIAIDNRKRGGLGEICIAAARRILIQRNHEHRARRPDHPAVSAMPGSVVDLLAFLRIRIVR